MNPELENPDNPSDAQHHFDQAYFYYDKTDEFEKALAECDAALDIDSDLADAHNLRGIVLEELSRIPEALEAYQQAISLDPNFTEAKENLVALQTEQSPKPQLVTIETFSHPTEAYLRKTSLDAAGIWAFVADDNMVIMNWLYSNAIGGVKLQVKAKDAEEAYEVLSPPKQEVKDDIEVANQAEDDDVSCLRCQATNIYYNRYNFRLIFAFWLISWLGSNLIGFGQGFILPFVRRRWYCDYCGYEWKSN